MKQSALRLLRTATLNNAAEFRPGQWEAIEALLNRERLLVVERTGWGKSIVYLLATQLLKCSQHTLGDCCRQERPKRPALPEMRMLPASLLHRKKLRRRDSWLEREILGERVRAGLAHARQNGKRLGRPLTASLPPDQVHKLRRSGLSKSEIARRLNIGRTSGAVSSLLSPAKK
jgi:hypothetical protein